MEKALLAGDNRADGPGQVRAAGFDAATSAMWLADHYHELVEKNRKHRL